MSDRHLAFWPKNQPRHLTLPRTNLFFNAEVSAARYPDKPFLVYYDTPVTFLQFKQEAERIAGFLQQECGVKKGDRVLLYMQNSPQFVLAYYGILRADAVVVPVNPMNMTEELRHYVNDTGATVAFAPQDLMGFLSQLFNGLALGALLALISSGLTIIYGTLGVLNLAHGAMFMLGGYAGYAAFQATGSFLVALAAGTLSVGLLGLVMERVIIRHFYRRPDEDQLLVTFGLGICFVEAVRLVFSSQSLSVQAPALLTGITSLGVMMYPTYRLAVVGICAVALLALYVVLYRTRLGMIVRAGIDDPVMVDSLGIDVYRVFMVVFGIGAMAAGFAGIVNAPVVSLTPEVGEAILVQAFVVVVIGGVGSFPGAVLGGLIAGEIISLTSMVNPGYAYVMLFAAMTIVLLVRPTGLMGAKGRQ